MLLLASPIIFWGLLWACGVTGGAYSALGMLTVAFIIATIVTRKVTYLAGAWLVTLGTSGYLLYILFTLTAPLVTAVLTSPHLPTYAAYALALAAFVASARYGGEADSFLRATLADAVAQPFRLQQYGDHGRESRRGR